MGLALALVLALAAQPVAQLAGWRTWLRGDAHSQQAAQLSSDAARQGPSQAGALGTTPLGTTPLGTTPSGAAGPEQDAFGFAGASEDLPSALFAYVSGSPPPQDGVPGVFAAEVLDPSGLDAEEQVNRGSTVGIVTPLSDQQARLRIERELAANGWLQQGAGEQPQAGEAPWQASYSKASGSLRWLHVALYPFHEARADEAGAGEGAEEDAAFSGIAPGRVNADRQGASVATTCVFHVQGVVHP